MPDTFAQAVLDDDLKNSDINQIIFDRELTITIKRITTTGDGFSTEISDYTSIGTIKGRIDNATNRTQYKYLLSQRKDVESIEQIYVGVTRDTDHKVMMGDVWEIDSQAFSVIAFTGGEHQNRTEVLLTTLKEAVEILSS
jgi:hypothetical protein